MVLGLACYPGGWVVGPVVLATVVGEAVGPNSVGVVGEKERARPIGLVELPIAVVVVGIGSGAGIAEDMGCQNIVRGLMVADSLAEEGDIEPDSLAEEGVDPGSLLPAGAGRKAGRR